MTLDRTLMPQVLVGGIFPATRVATPNGWRAAAFLRPGQVVLTLGRGPQPVLAVEIQPAPLWVQVLPAGACGNRCALRLPPGQYLMIDARFAAAPATESRALLPAQALEGWRNIEAAANVATPLVLRLSAPGMIHAGPGLILAMPGADDAAAPDRTQPPRLTLSEARAMVARLQAEDLGDSLSQAALRGA